MKKTVIASVALAAALFAVSCQKETNPAQNVSGPMTISAVSEGLNTPTKTELAFKYDVLWSASDKIYVKDASGNHDTFTLQNGAGTTKGTFKQDGQVTFTGEVQAYYPATMLDGGSPVWPASQTNDQTIPMYCKKTLSGEAEERMDFSSLGSVLQIVFNTTQAGVTLQSIEIKDGSKTMSGAFHVDENGMAVIDATDKAGITLDLGTGKALGKGANYFNIAVPAGDYQDLTLVFTATDGVKCTMTKGKVNIAYNAVGRLTLMGEKFKADVPAGALPGVFSVSATKKVHFSKGNLTYDVNASTDKWKFYEHQYDYATNYDANLISLFTWGYDATKSIVPNGKEYVTGHTTDGETFSKSEDWGYVFGGESSVWRTLTTAEWQYLFSYDGSSSGGQNYDNDTRRGKYKTGVKVCGKENCVVIAPDGWNLSANSLQAEYSSSSSPMTWEQAEAAGLVCLPAAGSRNGSGVSKVGVNGSYWSSAAYDEDDAYDVYFSSNGVFPRSTGLRYLGYSVRLITESN